MKPIVIALALMLLPTPAAAEPVRSLAQLPPIVQEQIRQMEGECRFYEEKLDYRLSEVVQVHSLSGARTRDYIVDGKKFGCRGCPGSMGCILAIYIKRHGAWSNVGGELASSWYTIRGPGKKTVLVITRRCFDGPEKCPETSASGETTNSVLRITRDAVTEKKLRAHGAPP